MKIKKLNKVLHRDLGYFFVFMTIIYSLSGIAVNHVHHWNPDFYVDKQNVNLNLPADRYSVTEEKVKSALEKIDQQHGFLMIDFPSDSKVKVYFKNGSLLYDLNKQSGELERVAKRPLLFEINFLHRNPGGLWTWISDIFAVSLLIISVTGLFILNGKNGIKGRGMWLASSGAVITLFFVFLVI